MKEKEGEKERGKEEGEEGEGERERERERAYKIRVVVTMLYVLCMLALITNYAGVCCVFSPHYQRIITYFLQVYLTRYFCLEPAALT